jgi:hypothetical protein
MEEPIRAPEDDALGQFVADERKQRRPDQRSSPSGMNS